MKTFFVSVTLVAATMVAGQFSVATVKETDTVKNEVAYHLGCSAMAFRREPQLYVQAVSCYSDGGGQAQIFTDDACRTKVDVWPLNIALQVTCDDAASGATVVHATSVAIAAAAGVLCLL